MRPSLPIISTLFIGVLFGSPETASPQGFLGGRLASQLEFGAQVGAAYTTPWFSAPDADGEIGPGAAAGAHATFWLTPVLGARVGALYARGSIEGTNGNGPFRLHTALYDAGVIWRPFFSVEGPIAHSSYLYAGIGGITALSSGDNDADDGSGCAASLRDRGICLPRRAGDATAGQVTLAIGADLTSFGNGSVLFAEAAAHGYDAPVRAAVAGAKDRFAITGTFTVGVKLLVGDILPPPPPVIPTPPALEPSDLVGTVVIRTNAAGAAVYLIPAIDLTLDRELLCRLTPIGGNPYFKGRTGPNGAFSLSGSTTNSWVVVIAQGPRRYESPLSFTAGSTVEMMMSLAAGRATSCN